MNEANIKNIKCGNCRYEFSETGSSILEFANSVASYHCPKCNFKGASTTAATLQESFSAANLADQLKTLLDKARADSLSSTVIVAILRAELEFAAELEQGGRHMLVQIMDLGFPEGAHSATIPYHSSREFFQNTGGI